MRTLLISMLLLLTGFVYGAPFAQGVVLGIDKADPAVLVVSGKNAAPLRVRLLDVIFPAPGTRFYQSAQQGVCTLLCGQTIAWDTLSVGVDGVPEVYAYLGDSWINQLVIRHGLAAANTHPHHPELVESENEAVMLAAGIWRSTGTLNQEQAVIVDGSSDLREQVESEVASSQSLIESR